MKKLAGDNELSKLFNIFMGVSVLFIVFYLITTFVTKKEQIVQKEAVDIQYEEILVGNMLNKKETSYYVLATLEDDLNNQSLELYASKYSEVTGALPVYKINLSNIFNNSFVGELSKLNTSNIDEIKFSKPTLLLIKDKKISAVYETSDKIISQLKSIIADATKK